MRITAMRRSRGSRRLLTIEVDGEPRFRLPDELVAREGLAVGRELGAAEVAALERAAAEHGALDAALRLLARKARTRAELARRLGGRGFAPEVVAAALDRLAGRGLLDDAVVAAEHARARVSQLPRGPRAIVAELRARGVDDAAARAAVDRAMEEEGLSELDLARRVARKWLARGGASPRSTARTRDAAPSPGGSPERGATRRGGAGGDIHHRALRLRLLQHLLRKGFGKAVAHEAAREALAAIPPGAPVD